MKYLNFGILVVPFLIAGTALANAGSDELQTPEISAAMAGVPANARPMVNPRPAPPASEVKSVSTSGLITGASSVGQTFEQRAHGSFGIPYSSTRVRAGQSKYTSASPNYLSTTYPYSAVGRLDFLVGTFNSFCTASIIRKGVLLTAAHCVQDFGSSARFKNWVFRPGYYGPTGATPTQIAPYGAWSLTSAIAISYRWAKGTDKGCGSARDNDLALFIVPKKDGKFIGDVTGQLNYGWGNYGFISTPKTGNLSVAAVSALGYPGLLDDGQIMQRTDGPTYTTTVCSGSNAIGQLWQGSDFTGGSSGGPWIVNFRTSTPVLTGGAAVGSYNKALVVVGVTSWGSDDPNKPKDNYSSQFRQNSAYPAADYGGYGAGNIGAIMNQLCTRNPAGSAKTYAQLGYCS